MFIATLFISTASIRRHGPDDHELIQARYSSTRHDDTARDDLVQDDLARDDLVQYDDMVHDDQKEKLRRVAALKEGASRSGRLRR